jgi:hypothetical protein
MCYQNSVVDRAMDSEHGGGPHVPGTPEDTTQPDEILEAIRRLPNDVLKDTVVTAKRLIDRTTAELACLVAELDSRGLTETDEGLSTTAWLRHRCRMTPTEASGTLKTARVLSDMPTIISGALDGEVPARSLQMLSQARDRHIEAFAVHEAVFGDVATWLSVGDLRKAISHWDQQVDYEVVLEDTEEAEQRAELFFTQTYLGRWDASGSFGIADGTVINTALRGYIQASYLDPTDRRPLPQRLAEAAVSIHRFWLDHNTTLETSGGEKPHITVVVDYKTLTGDAENLPELDGHAIDPETLRRWACDAGIVRIITDAESKPIDVGRRTRTIPPSLRRALELRDGSCTWEGCDAPVSWCDAHHITHWADGGETNLDNTKLLCRKHHTRTHRTDKRMLRASEP